MFVYLFVCLVWSPLDTLLLCRVVLYIKSYSLHPFFPVLLTFFFYRVRGFKPTLVIKYIGSSIDFTFVLFCVSFEGVCTRFTTFGLYFIFQPFVGLFLLYNVYPLLIFFNDWRVVLYPNCIGFTTSLSTFLLFKGPFVFYSIKQRSSGCIVLRDFLQDVLFPFLMVYC